MPTTIAALPLSNLPALVIDEHVCATNRFLQLSRLTLDDLNCYAQPLSEAALLVMRGAHDPVSDAEILAVFRRAMNDYRAIDDGLDGSEEAV